MLDCCDSFYITIWIQLAFSCKLSSQFKQMHVAPEPYQFIDNTLVCILIIDYTYILYLHRCNSTFDWVHWTEGAKWNG